MAQSLLKALGESDVTVWDDSQIRPGEDWIAPTERALSTAQSYVVIISPKTATSARANFEIGVAASRAAESRDVRVIPILIGGAKWADVPPVLRKRAGIDASELNFERLVVRIREAILVDQEEPEQRA